MGRHIIAQGEATTPAALRVIYEMQAVQATKEMSFLQSASFIYINAGSGKTKNIRNGLLRMTNVFEERAPIDFIWHSDLTQIQLTQTMAG